MKTSGASRRENADVYLLFDIRNRISAASLRADGSRECAPDDGLRKASIVRLVLKLDCFVAALLAMTADG
jgi:hypothetical protein